ncbi:hypothetical protein T265_09591 [Opisthorchis viverrini]|uniref:Uncharacterized protein n=1 Tax=Opisthorchis viverrini TaxID=6198 RepID=A0A074Z5F3_OPIVI|nr:hypothetical protein T265_09591 [Opisthorchis viverrini]KER22308.1 hypothetical protein T265_09591 [Opisthorchis viverrini]
MRPTRVTKAKLSAESIPKFNYQAEYPLHYFETAAGASGVEEYYYLPPDGTCTKDYSRHNGGRDRPTVVELASTLIPKGETMSSCRSANSSDPKYRPISHPWLGDTTEVKYSGTPVCPHDLNQRRLEFRTRLDAQLATGIWLILGHDWLLGSDFRPIGSRLEAGPSHDTKNTSSERPTSFGLWTVSGRAQTEEKVHVQRVTHLQGHYRYDTSGE